MVISGKAIRRNKYTRFAALFARIQCCGLPKWSSGFTLIEVLISVAIIAITFTTLLGVHIRSIEMGSAARDITIASIIAKEQIELARQGQVSLASDRIVETESEHPGFFWDIKSFDTLLSGVKEIQVTVYKKIGERKKDATITLSTYLLR